MKETIKFYYNIYPDTLYEILNGYYFFVGDIKYYFVLFDRDIKEIEFLVKISNDLYNKNILVDTFIQNKDGKFYVILEDKVYVMLRVNSIESDLLNIKDIVYFNNLLISDNVKSIDSNWAILWGKRVDEFESMVSELNTELPIVQESFDYFVGLAENAIVYFNEAVMSTSLANTKINLNHKRIPEMLYSGYINNPLTFTFDYDVRDVSEYIKLKFFKSSIDYDEIEDLILSGHYSKGSLMILFARLMYPSYYFDTLKSVILEEVSESELLIYINKVNMYEDFLLDIYNLISKKEEILPVEWLKK